MLAVPLRRKWPITRDERKELLAAANGERQSYLPRRQLLQDLKREERAALLMPLRFGKSLDSILAGCQQFTTSTDPASI